MRYAASLHLHQMKVNWASICRNSRTFFLRCDFSSQFLRSGISESINPGVIATFTTESGNVNAYNDGVSGSTTIQEFYFQSRRSGFKHVCKLDDALALYRQMVRIRPLPSEVEFTQLLNALVKMKCYSDVVTLFNDMCLRPIRINRYVLHTVLNALCSLPRVDLAFSVLARFIKSGDVVDAPIFSMLLKGLYREDKFQEAHDLFLKIFVEKLCEPDKFLLTIVIDGLCKLGFTSRALNLLRLFEKKGICNPGVYAYNTVIDSLCKDEMVDSAIGLLTEMIDKGIAPDVVTYNSLIHGLCSCDRWEEVEVMLKQMADYRVAFNVRTYSILVDGFCKRGWVQDGLKVIETMLQNGVEPNVVTYAALLDGYCSQGKMNEAEQLLKNMIHWGCKPDIYAYDILMNGYCKNRNVDKAIQVQKC